MAGYNRGIVATRKLNKKNKARLGRGGDTKIRKVDGKDSHVNALEAWLIDVNKKAGEEYTKRVGSGTTNPLTGMPEYVDPRRLDYDELQDLSHSDYMAYLAQWGLSDVEIGATEDPRGAGTEEIGLAGERQVLSLTTAERELGATRDLGVETARLERRFTEQRLGQAQDFAKAGAGRQYQTQTAGLASGLASGQRAAGKGLAQARAGAASAAGRSGLARGSAQAGFESQRGDIMAGSRELSKQYQAGRTQAVGGLGMAQTQAEDIYGLGMQQSAATEALGLKKATSAYDIGMATAKDRADFTYKEEMFGIGKGITEDFYSAMGEYGGEARDYILTGAGGGAIKKITAAGQKQIMVEGEGWVDASDEEYDAWTG